MKDYLVQIQIVELPRLTHQSIPQVVSLPDDAIPIRLEYRSGAQPDILPCLWCYYLVPCDKEGNIIKEERKK